MLRYDAISKLIYSQYVLEKIFSRAVLYVYCIVSIANLAITIMSVMMAVCV